MEQVTVNGITYNVLQSHTPENHEACGRPNTARMMRENGAKRSIGAQRPRGKVQYYIVEYENGLFSSPVSLGR
jgi:hypothetical protein